MQLPPRSPQVNNNSDKCEIDCKKQNDVYVAQLPLTVNTLIYTVLMTFLSLMVIREVTYHNFIQTSRKQPLTLNSSNNFLQVPYTQDIKYNTANYASQDYNAFILQCNLPNCKDLLKSRGSIVFNCKDNFYVMEMQFVRPVHVQYINLFSRQPFASNIRQVKISSEGVDIGNIQLSHEGGMFKLDHQQPVKSLRFDFQIFENKFQMCQIGNVGVYGNNILKMLENNFDEASFLKQFQTSSDQKQSFPSELSLDYEQEKLINRNLFYKINTDMQELQNRTTELQAQLNNAIFIIIILIIVILTFLILLVVRIFFFSKNINFDEVQTRSRSNTLDGPRLGNIPNLSNSTEDTDMAKRISSCYDLQRIGRYQDMSLKK